MYKVTQAPHMLSCWQRVCSSQRATFWVSDRECQQCQVLRNPYLE